ncbi:hypothetical protein Peur_015233 [Populus x canadensis]
MLPGYAKSGMTNPARKLFDKMPKRDVVSWNTMVIGSWAAGFLCKMVISSLVADAYANCGEMSDATRLFDGMNVKDVLARTTMVLGYAQCGDMVVARELFDLMPNENSVAWTALISGSRCACASIASVKLGKQIDGYLIRTNVRRNTIVVSSLIDMYSKCGSLEVARLVFYLMGNKQAVDLCNPMIYALAQHDHGLVEEGLRLLESMTGGNGIFPYQEHYARLIDLLGQARHFDKLMGEHALQDQ